MRSSSRIWPRASIFANGHTSGIASFLDTNSTRRNESRRSNDRFFERAAKVKALLDLSSWKDEIKDGPFDEFGANVKMI